jgi:hypothetical protein
MSSPSSRSMALLRREGYAVDVCERWLPHAGVHRDLFGIGDLVAAKAGEPGPLLVQVTTGDHLANRMAKARAEPRLHAWMGCGGRFELHGWSKREGRWFCRRVSLRPQDLEPIDLTPRPRLRRRRRGERQKLLWDPEGR